MLIRLRWTRNGFKTLFHETKNEQLNLSLIIEAIRNSTKEELNIFTNLVIPYIHQLKISESWTKDHIPISTMINFDLNHDEVKMLC